LPRWSLALLPRLNHLAESDSQQGIWNFWCRRSRQIISLASPMRRFVSASEISGSRSISLNYDGLDRLTSETSPQGSVGYAYDAAGRRTSMTVAGQAAVTYGFDNANRLTQIVQGNSTVQFGYDVTGRRSSLTLPNGVAMSYIYDSASQLTGINHTFGQNLLGNLAYSYDLSGRQTGATGSFARTGLPQPISTTAYNAANQLTQWGTATPTYDANGNMLSDGTRILAEQQHSPLAGRAANLVTQINLERRPVERFLIDRPRMQKAQLGVA